MSNVLESFIFCGEPPYSFNRSPELWFHPRGFWRAHRHQCLATYSSVVNDDQLGLGDPYVSVLAGRAEGLVGGLLPTS